MDYKNNTVLLEVSKPEIQKLPRKRYVRSLEYEVIANLALQQHTEDSKIRRRIKFQHNTLCKASITCVFA